MDILRSSLPLFVALIFLSAANAAPLPSTVEGGPNDIPRIAKFTISEPRCHGLRGTIHVDSILGGTAPFYFSLDGENYSTNPVLDNIPAGEHSLFVKDVLGGVSDTMFIMKEPEPLNVELFMLNNPINKGEDAYIEAIVTPSNAQIHEISWRPPSLIETHFSLTQNLNLEKTTNVNVLVKDINGCPASNQIRVLIDDRTVYMPNAFLPESDQNAFFTVYTGGGVTNVVSLKIYDRWGRPVFEKENFEPNNPLQGWDGRINGKIAPPGTYLYVAQVEFFDGKQEQVTGDLMIAPNK